MSDKCESLNAALSSLQGEAVEVKSLIERLHRCCEHAAEYCDTEHYHQSCARVDMAFWQLFPNATQLFTYPPDASAKIARLEAENATLYTTMMAAAVEIQEHWEAHCDDEGYGPSNLIHRLESGIASRYGYDAETVVVMEAKIAELEQRLTEVEKDAERWRAILHSGAYSPSDFGNPIGFAGRSGQYTKEQLNASADAYIAKYCNAIQESKGGAA